MNNDSSIVIFLLYQCLASIDESIPLVCLAPIEARGGHQFF